MLLPRALCCLRYQVAFNGSGNVGGHLRAFVFQHIKQRLHNAFIAAAVALAAAGLLTLMPWAGVNADLDMTGVFYAALAAVFWGTYIVVGRKAGTQAGASASAWGGLIGTLAALPWALWMTDGVLIPAPVLADALPLAFFVGFAASALPYGLEIVSLRLVPPQVFGVLMSIEPAVAALFGFLLLGEALSFSQWAAIGMVIAASLLVTLGQRKGQNS